MESTGGREGGREGVCWDGGEGGVATRHVPEDTQVKFVCKLEQEVLLIFVPYSFWFTSFLPDDLVSSLFCVTLLIFFPLNQLKL